MSEIDRFDKPQWIRRVVREYEGRLLRYAAQITGDIERGRDIVQETFMRLCEQDTGELEEHLAAWLFTVCRNLAVDVQRKEKRMKSMTLQQAAEQPSPAKSQAQTAEDQETSVHIEQLMGNLSDNQREVVRLKFQSGLSYGEIARVLDLSVSNVGYLIHTAIQKLRRQLKVDCP